MPTWGWFGCIYLVFRLCICQGMIVHACKILPASLTCSLACSNEAWPAVCLVSLMRDICNQRLNMITSLGMMAAGAARGQGSGGEVVGKEGEMGGDKLFQQVADVADGGLLRLRVSSKTSHLHLCGDLTSSAVILTHFSSFWSHFSPAGLLFVFPLSLSFCPPSVLSALCRCSLSLPFAPRCHILLKLRG